MRTLVRHVKLNNGRSDLQYNVVDGDNTLVLDPMPVAGWRVVLNGEDVGEVVPVDEEENWTITPLRIEVNGTRRVVENPADAKEFVVNLLLG